MEFPHIPPTAEGRSPRRELQGPRPTPLRISNDSHKIKKPPLAPPHPSQPQPPPRQPVIIYTVSPKIIHTTPGDFRNLVQRLTGSNSSSNPSTHNINMVSSSNDPFNGDASGGGMISPAARYATIEKAMSPLGKKQHPISGDIIEGVEIMNHAVDQRPNIIHGILSPGPASLSPIPSTFFSPPSMDPSMVSFLHDLSPVLHSGTGFIMPSPFNLVSPITPSIDLFNYFLD